MNEEIGRSPDAGGGTRSPLRDERGAPLRLGVDLAELATPRNLARFRLLTQAFGADAIILLKRPRSRPCGRLEDSALDSSLQTREACESGAGRLEQPGQPLDAVLSLADDPVPTGAPWPTRSRYGTWALVDGDPTRCGCGPSALPQAIAFGRPRVGMSVVRPQTAAGASPILAFCEVPRRPWDSLERLRQRLDAHLPLLLRDALEHVRANRPSELAHTVRAGTSRWVHGFNLAQCLRDGKYLGHLLASALCPYRGEHKTRIIGLHDPAPDVLDDLLTRLSRSTRFLRYSESMTALREGRPLKPGAIMTFDDGYKQNMALLDVLDRHRCPAMFFISTRLVDTDAAFWFMDHEHKHRGQKEGLKKMSYQSYLSASVAPPRPPRSRSVLTSAEIRSLMARGHEVGVHTHNHPFLGNQDVDVRYEITECHDRLREIVADGELPLHIAYPDGDFNEQVVKIARDLRAVSAVTTRPAPVEATDDVLQLPRYIVGDADYPGAALLKLTSVYAHWQTSRWGHSA